MISRPPHPSTAGHRQDSGIDARVIALIERIYDAAAHPERWTAFISALSQEIGDPAIVMNMEIPNRRDSAISYRIHSDEHFGKVFAELVETPLGSRPRLLSNFFRPLLRAVHDG